MNNSTNTLTSNNTVKSATRFMDKVVNACDQLIETLKVSKDEVSSFGTKVADNVMENEYVDRVIGYLDLLKKFTLDLKKHAHNHFQDEMSITHIIDHLNETSAKLHAKMLENNFFFNHYSLKVVEITKTIEAVIHNMPVKA